MTISPQLTLTLQLTYVSERNRCVFLRICSLETWGQMRRFLKSPRHLPSPDLPASIQQQVAGAPAPVGMTGWLLYQDSMMLNAHRLLAIASAHTTESRRSRSTGLPAAWSMRTSASNSKSGWPFDMVRTFTCRPAAKCSTRSRTPLISKLREPALSEVEWTGRPLACWCQRDQRLGHSPVIWVMTNRSYTESL